MQCYCATLVLVFGAMYRKTVLNPSSSIDPSLVYDEFGSLLAAVSLFAFGFCFALVVKVCWQISSLQLFRSFWLSLNVSPFECMYLHNTKRSFSLHLSFCAAMRSQGYHYPSGRDGGKTGSLIVDFYWGTELYPRVLG